MPTIPRQCVILVGGLGTRLGELTKTIPKPLLPVGGPPFLETLLREAARRGFNEIILLAGHHANLVFNYVAQSKIATELGVTIRISVEPEPLGTAGALIHAEHLLAEEFLLLNGDTWFDFNWLDLPYRAQRMDCSVAMALRMIANPDRFETVVLREGIVESFRGRSAGLKSGLINGGVYWFRKRALRGISSPCSLETAILPSLASGGALRGWCYDGYFIDIGIPETYSAAQRAVPMQQIRPAAFMDRDGVLNKDTGYVHQREKFVWNDGAEQAIRLLNDLGYYVFVVTNQAGIAHGYYGEAQFEELKGWITEVLRRQGALIDDWRFSPYHPEAKVPRYRVDHNWRKPRPGMIRDLLASWPVDLARSFLIGDRVTDMEAAKAARIPGYLFDGGNLFDFVRRILDTERQPWM